MRLTRAGALTWLVAAAVLLVLVPSTGPTLDRLASPSFPTVLAAALELGLVALCTWAVVVLGACAAGGPAARAAARLVPRAARGLLVAGVVTTITVGSAHATTGDPAPSPSVAADLDRPGLEGLTLPDRPTPRAAVPAPASTPAPDADADLPDVAPTVPPPRADRPAPDDADADADAHDRAAETSSQPGAPAPPTTVVVRSGDTLWRIAAAALGPTAGDAEVAAGVRRWHAANGAVIGPDPDVLVPGQRLVDPEDVR